MSPGQWLLRGAVMLFVLVILPITIGILAPEARNDAEELRVDNDDADDSPSTAGAPVIVVSGDDDPSG